MLHDRTFLPEEVILNILHRLPVKSIGQCRCICKLWLALLSKPQFIRSHLMNQIERKHFLEEPHIISIHNPRFLSTFTLRNANAHHLFDEITTLSKDLYFAGQTIFWAAWGKVYCSCDGLVLVSNEKGTKFLINPTTKEIKQVPRSPFALQGYTIITLYGFGYDSVSDDYKIVTVSYNAYDEVFGITETFVSIYSVKNSAWKRAGSFPFDPNDRSSGVFVDGYIHLLAYKESDRTSRFVSVIAAFDLAQEKFSEVPLPISLVEKQLENCYLKALGGCLSLYLTNRCDITSNSIGNSNSNSDCLETDVWVMKEYGVQESWTKFTISDLERVPLTPVCFLGQGQLVLVKHSQLPKYMPNAIDKLVMYNIKEGTFKDILVPFHIVHRFYAWCTFMESLVSPHYSNQCHSSERNPDENGRK